MEEAGKVYTNYLKTLPDANPYKEAVLPYTTTKTFPNETQNVLKDINNGEYSNILDLIENNDKKHSDVTEYITKILQINSIEKEIKDDVVVEIVTLNNINNIPDLSDFSEPRDLDIYIAFLFALCLHANANANANANGNDEITDPLKTKIKETLDKVQNKLQTNKMLLCFYKSNVMTNFLNGSLDYTFTDPTGNKITIHKDQSLMSYIIPEFLKEKENQINENVSIIKKQVDNANTKLTPLKIEELDGGKIQKPTKRRKTRKSKKTRKNKRKKSTKRSRKSRQNK